MLENRNARKLSMQSKSSSANSSNMSLEPLCVALDGCDPLTLFAKHEAIDPLSQMAAEHVNINFNFKSSLREIQYSA